MPPRLAPGPAPEGSSRGRGPGGGGQADKQPKEPKMWGRTLTEDQCDIFFYAYKVYKHEGRRPLTQDEVCGVMSKSQRKDMTTVKTTFDIFDDPKNPWTQTHERSVKVKGKAERLEERVARALKEYLSTDEKARNIAATFEGITERPKFPQFESHPRWKRNVGIQNYKLFPLYVISNWCVHANGSHMKAFDRYRVARLCLFDDAGGNVSVVERFADPKHEWAATMAKLIMQHKEIFLNNTEKLLNKYREELKDLGLEISFERGAPQSDPDPKTTAALGNLALKTAAPNPYLAPQTQRPQIPTGGLSQVQDQQQHPPVARVPYASRPQQEDQHKDPDAYFADVAQSRDRPNQPPTQGQYYSSAAQVYGVQNPGQPQNTEQRSRQSDLTLPPITNPRYRDPHEQDRQPAGQRIQPSVAGGSRHMESEGERKRKTKSDSPNQPESWQRLDPRQARRNSLRLNPDLPPPPPPPPRPPLPSTSEVSRNTHQDSARKRGRHDRR